AILCGTCVGQENGRESRMKWVRGPRHDVFLLGGLLFEWDSEKADLNRRKHGIRVRGGSKRFSKWKWTCFRGS
ncbi:MAG: hypothetical protein M3Y50_11630, partial [Acidobacteriota bacterium]|nr:hypothetical protein [Acidobacteriota bacterium]